MGCSFRCVFYGVLLALVVRDVARWLLRFDSTGESQAKKTADRVFGGQVVDRVGRIDGKKTRDGWLKYTWKGG